MEKFLFTLLTSIALSGLTFSVSAADKAPADAPAKAKKTGSIPFRGTVSAVDPAAQTVSLKGAQKDRVFVVTAETTLTKNGAPATINDVAAGDYASGAYLEKAGKMELKSLKVGPAPKKKEK